MTRTDKAAKGYLANVVQLMLFMALQAILAPTVLKLAGVATLGAFGVLLQAVAYCTLFDTGCSMALARFLAQSHGIAGPDRFATIFTTGRTCLLLSGVAIGLLAVLLAGPFVSMLRLTDGLAWQTHASILLLAAWFVARTPLASYDDALVATQNLAVAQTIVGLQNASRALGSLAAVLMGAGLLGMIIAAVAADMAAGLFCRVYYLRLYPERKPSWGFPDRALLRSMLAFTIRALLSQLSTILTFASGQLVAGRLWGAAGVAVIYTNLMPAQMASNVFMRLSDNASPAINELFARGETAKLHDAFLRIHRLTLNLAIPLAFGILFLYRSLITLWVGAPQYGGAGMTAAVAALTVVIAMEHINVVFAMACGEEKIAARMAMLEAVITVTLSFLMGRLWGPGGIPAAVTIGILPKTLTLWRRLQSIADVRLSQYIGTCILPATAASSVALAAAWAMSRVWGTGGWLTTGATAAVFGAVYAAVAYSICLTPNERGLVRRYVAAGLAWVPAGARLRPVRVDVEG